MCPCTFIVLLLMQFARTHDPMPHISIWFTVLYAVARLYIVAQCFMQNELKWVSLSAKSLKIHALASFVCVAVHQSAACSQSRHAAAVQLCCIHALSSINFTCFHIHDDVYSLERSISIGDDTAYYSLTKSNTKMLSFFEEKN